MRQLKDILKITLAGGETFGLSLIHSNLTTDEILNMTAVMIMAEWKIILL